MAFIAESLPAQGQYVVLKVVRVTGAAFSGIPMDQFLYAPVFSTHNCIGRCRGHTCRYVIHKESVRGSAVLKWERMVLSFIQCTD